MHRLQQRNHQLLFTIGLIFLGSVIVLAGKIFNPSTFTDYMSPDGVFSDGVIDRAAIASLLRWGVILVGTSLLLGGIYQYIAYKNINKIEYYIGKFNIPRVNLPKVIVIGIFSLLALILLNKTIHFALGDQWKPVIGYEYYWIAESLADGHGYSLPANHRWYFDDFKSVYPSNQYYPTALEEPVYPLLLAFFFKYFGEYGHLTVLLLNVVLLYITSLVIYFLGKKVFNSRLGIIASIALLTWWWFEISWLTLGVFSPAVLGGLCITVSAYLLIWSLEKVSVKRGVLLGIMLAFGCLTLSAGMLFVPLAVLSTLLLKRPLKPLAWWPALSIVVTVMVVMAPWTLRNYMVFGQVIPVRTGFGLALHQSNPILAATYSTGSHACVKELGPIWAAKNAKDAILQVRKNQEKRMAMYRRSYECIEMHAPAGYSGYNEAQRDKVYLEKSMDFIGSNPKTFLDMTRYRLQAFLVGWSQRHTAVTLLALIGALMAWRNRNAAILVVLIAAYTFTFSFATSLMYRYRYPIEPILFVLATGIPVFIFSKIKSFMEGNRNE